MGTCLVKMDNWIRKEGDMFVIDTSSWGIEINSFTCTKDDLHTLNWVLYGLYPTGSLLPQKEPFTFNLPFLKATVDATTACDLHDMLEAFTEESA